MSALRRDQQARLAAIQAASARLVETLELPTLLNAVMDALIALTNAERGFILLIDERTGRPSIAAARHFERDQTDAAAVEISLNIVEKAVRSGLPILTSNALEDSRFADYQSVTGYQLRSIMCAPLRARGQRLGAVYVDNRYLTGVFEQEDVDLLQAFANQAALAIDNARLFAQTDDALQRRVEELSVLQQIDHQLHGSLELSQVLALALEWAVRLTGAAGGSLALLEGTAEGKPALRIMAQHGRHSDPAYRLDLDHPTVAQAMAGGRPLTSHQPNPMGAAPCTLLAAPIGRAESVLGVILLDASAPHVFGRDELAIVERLADRAAVAIANSRLYAAARDAKRRQSDFIAVVTHELRAPMTAIMGYTDLLLSGVVGPVPDEQAEMLRVVLHNVESMRVLVQDLSDLNRMEIGQLKFKTAEFDLRALVREVAQGQRQALRRRRQRLLLDLGAEPLMVRADRVRTAQILTNLLTNAHKYTPDDGRIGVRARADGERVVVQVVDTGIGISAADRPKLFTRFFRAEAGAVREQAGWGLGLSIVRMLVEGQGGRIDWQSQPGRGSLFVFSLPVAASPPADAALPAPGVRRRLVPMGTPGDTLPRQSRFPRSPH